MGDKQFRAMLVLIVPQIVRMIAERYSLSETEAAIWFYKSQVYELLEDEGTKVWQLSPLTIFNMYAGEKEAGKIEIPEG
ncbi:MAG: hypothetical protein IJE90_01775 [Clostridia bacterium]|nr:hypothetical protein [Clostridia bacterium]